MSPFSKRQQFFGLITWLVISYSASAIGALASIQAGAFYAELVQPDWAPPAWLFGPVWTTLYALMGISAWLIWRVAGFNAHRRVLILFFVQLILNALWSWLFFSWSFGALSVIEIMLLWAFILATVVSFWRIHRLAGILLMPYFAWVSFAAVLNYSLWRLNPGILA